MAVSLSASADLDSGGTPTVQSPASLVDGLATWIGTSRHTSLDYSGEAASIDSVAAALNSAVGTVGANRVHIDIPWWVEASFPTADAAST